MNKYSLSLLAALLSWPVMSFAEDAGDADASHQLTIEDVDGVGGGLVIEVGGNGVVEVQRIQVVQGLAKADPEPKNEKADPAQGGPAVNEKELRQRMRALEQELQEARNKFQKKANRQRKKAEQAAAKSLDDITLAKNPTREQCVAYLDALRKACEGRRSFSSNDPATKKLKQIPEEHFDLLLAEISSRTPLHFYANYAVREIDPETVRKRFVASIDENPNNIGVIVMYGWTEDIRPAIIRHLNSANGTVSPAWFQAAVEIDEPSLYPKLHDITIQSRHANQFISMLEMLPHYDFVHTINTCWKRAREGKLSVNRSAFSAKAASYGNVDALGALINQLRLSGGFVSHSSSHNARRANVLKFIDYRGSNQEIQQWYKANKNKLVFDHLTKRFVLPEDF